MSNKDVILSMILVVIIVIFFGFVAGYKYGEKIGTDIGYKQACNDFYNGQLKYEPIEVKTIQWKYINKETN